MWLVHQLHVYKKMFMVSPCAQFISSVCEVFIVGSCVHQWYLREGVGDKIRCAGKGPAPV